MVEADPAANNQEEDILSNAILHGVDKITEWDKHSQEFIEKPLHRTVAQAGFIEQYNMIGLFFAEPHDISSRIWGSIVMSLKKDLNENSTTSEIR